MNDKVLIHHGIKGQKWGVRRYQNYDGSYTQTGLKRYRQSLDRYNSSVIKLEEAKRSGNGLEISRAKSEAKEAKRKMNRDYKQIKKDYKADQGKELYKSGRTITESQVNRRIAQTGISLLGYGSAYVAYRALSGQKKMKRFGNTVLNYDVGTMSAATIAAGTTAVNIVLEGIGASKDSKMRAFYGHTRPKD